MKIVIGGWGTENLASFLASADISGLLNGISPPVYYAYTPSWGRLNERQSAAFKEWIHTIDECIFRVDDRGKLRNLQWLKANFEFTLLLDEVGRKLEPSWKIRERVLSGRITKYAQRHTK